MFVQLICKDRNKDQKDEIYEVLGLLCQREQIQIEEKADQVIINVCPEGKITVTEEDKDVILQASTRHAGPGFHAFVVEFFLDLEEEIPGEYELKDDLNYEGDFDQLVKVYEDEIVYMKDLLLSNEQIRHQNYIYDETYILPILNSNEILCATGCIDEKEFKELDPKILLDSFYVWNSWDKDARFYKNAALHLLAKESVGQYCDMDDQTFKYANAICDFIELAHESDTDMALPVQEYRELCQYLQRKDKIQSCKQMEEEVYQFRKKEVYHLFEDMKIVANGAAIRSYDPTTQSLCLTSPYIDETQWDWLMQISSHSSICEHVMALLDKESVSYRQKEIWLNDWKEDSYFVVEAIIDQDNRKMYFHCVVADEANLPYIKQCIKESEFQKGIE